MLDKPLKPIFENRLYQCENCLYLIACDKEVLEFLRNSQNEYIFINGFEDLHLEDFLNLDSSLNDRLRVVLNLINIKLERIFFTKSYSPKCLARHNCRISKSKTQNRFSAGFRICIALRNGFHLDIEQTSCGIIFDISTNKTSLEDSEWQE